MTVQNTPCLILCEGINDLLLLKAFVSIYYDCSFGKLEIDRDRGKEERFFVKGKIGENFKVTIREIGGCDRLSSSFYIQQLEDNRDIYGGQNIIIFDADKLGRGNNGFTSCCRKLNDIREQNKVSFEQFLWPDNERDGVVEHLLVELIPKKYKAVFDCIEAHQICLQSLTEEVKTHVKFAELKDKVGFYLHTLNQVSKPSQRDYTQSCWDLNAEASEALRRLKNFLDSYFLV